MGTQSEALAYKKGQGSGWEGHKREGKSSIRLYFHKYKPYILLYIAYVSTMGLAMRVLSKQVSR